MIREERVPLFDLAACLSEALDLVSPAVANHHEQVAYAALALGSELGLTVPECNNLVLAGMLHDAGAFTLQNRLDLLHFEVSNPRQHCDFGSRLLQMFEPLSAAADLVRFHHVPWADGAGLQQDGLPVPPHCHILHLADRIAVLLDRGRPTLGQVPHICERIERHAGRLFTPEAISAFRSLAAKESFWLDISSPRIGSILRRKVRMESAVLGIDGLTSLSGLFRRIIDFRSHFTATHSSGVGSVASALAGLVGFSPQECRIIAAAGNIHDLGKLAVPVEILEKPARLTTEEFEVMRSHTFHTYRTLEPVPGLEFINATGAFHHERLDGSGYPFHLQEDSLTLSARIMAVADVFTAVTEDRPYRAGMTQSEALSVLRDMAGGRALDAGVVAVVERNFDEIDGLRIEAQKGAVAEYEHFLRSND